MANHPAGFWVRLLADLIDLFLLSLAFSAMVFVLADSQTLAQLVYNLLFFLVVLLLPLGILSIFYRPYFTHRFGGNIGKLITGLRVTDLEGRLLTFKRSLFRYFIGYAFSGVLFGLGFFSIIRDPDKRGFHDKATPSKVVITGNLWPLGLVILITLMTAHFLLWSNAIQKLSQSPLKSEFGYLMLNLKLATKKEKAENTLYPPEGSLNSTPGNLKPGEDTNNPTSEDNLKIMQSN